MFLNLFYEIFEIVYDRKMGIFVVNDEMNFVFKFNCLND